MKSYFRVQADPDLPRAERIEAGKHNSLVGKTFPTKELANIARYNMGNHHKYVVAECISVGADIL
jgi:hypothetical protein